MMDISIICFTYNHKKYIRDTMEGFLKQKGDYEYEIIVHDDASQDGTIEILKEFKDKYEDKITLVLQKENQYSKGINDFLSMTVATNIAAPKLSVIALRVHAKVRIRMAGTIALKPEGRHSIHSVKERTLRHR